MNRLSIVMTGKNRTALLNRSLFAMCRWQQFKPEQAELVYVDDCSDDIQDLITVLLNWSDYFYQVKLIGMDKRRSIIPVAWNCPALGINLAVKEAENEVILKTDPECLPISETVLNSLLLFKENGVCFFDTRLLTQSENQEFTTDAMEETDPNQIHEFKLRHLSGGGLWAVHHRSAKYAYWFGTVFSRARFMSIGGVDEQFLKGFAGDDDDWANRMRMSGAEWKWSQNLQILHQFHGTANAQYHLSPQHQHNIALVRHNMENGIVVVNKNHDWGSSGALVSRVLIRSGKMTSLELEKVEMSA